MASFVCFRVAQLQIYLLFEERETILVMELISLIIFGVIVYLIWYFWGGNSGQTSTKTNGSQAGPTSKLYPDLSQLQKSNSIFSMFRGNSYDAIMDKFTTLEEVQSAIRMAGLESCNLIFGKFIHYIYCTHTCTIIQK